jgi:electron transfer flavoprotein alpha subunit
VGSGEAVRWHEVIHPQAAPDNEAALLARLARAAFSDPALGAEVPRLVAWPAGPLGEEAAALLAADLDAASLGRCTSLALQGNEVEGRRPAFGGRVDVHLRSQGRFACAAWRPQGTVPPLQPLAADRVGRIHVAIEPAPQWAIEPLHDADGQVRLEGARLVVSGGRGMGGPEGFALLSRIAGPLGAALGGSLPAVDAGWVPVARQVGQSGRFVSPRLYLAVAISGTPQHLAGVAGSTRIVAVNQDPEAPIFGVADVGVVADWRELLPLLAQRLDTANATAAG